MNKEATATMNKGTAIIGFILSFLVGMTLMWGINKSSGNNSGITGDATLEKGGWSDSASPISVTSKDPVWGQRNAPVTLVVFSEFQCPYCAQVEKSFEQIQKNYGPNKVRIVWKSNPLPFHKDARPASVAAETLRALEGNDAFWKFHKLAFANQRELTRENFEKWARQSGAKDLAKFKEALDKNTYAAKVDEDAALGSKLGVRGTPHTFVNGIAVNGAQPVTEFKKVIDAQLAEAEAMIKAGTKADQVYVELSKKNFKAPATEQEQAKAKAPEVDKTVWKVPVGNSPSKGPADALVTLVVFSEYQCPYCKRVEPTLHQLMKDYEGKLRIVWKDRPLPYHDKAEPAAHFALEARKQKSDKGFWEAHDLLFENSTALAMENLEQYAKTLGLNWTAAKNAIEKKAHQASLDSDGELADTLKASGTPHMFINGRRFVGARSIDAFKKLIDEELAKAEKLVSDGTAKANLYETLMKTAKTPPPPPPPEKKEVPAPTANNPFKGGKNAKIVIQLFSDFECPYCSRVNSTMQQILDKYGDKVKIVWRNLPLAFHKNAKLAAEAAVEVFKQKGNEGFWKFHDKLFENQRALSRKDLEKYAQEIGCDMAKFKAALDNHTHAKTVEADMGIAEKASIRGTPASVVNGIFVSGAQPFPQFDKFIKLAQSELK